MLWTSKMQIFKRKSSKLTNVTETKIWQVENTVRFYSTVRNELEIL